MSGAPGEVLVIGYGNTLRGDDGVGPWVAERLAQKYAPPRARILAVHQLTPELAERMSHHERAILIDARADAAPGTLSARWLSDDPPSDGLFTHHFSPEVLVMLARRLFGGAPAVLLIGIGVDCVELHEGLSPAVEATASALVDGFDRWLESQPGSLPDFPPVSPSA